MMHGEQIIRKNSNFRHELVEVLSAFCSARELLENDTYKSVVKQILNAGIEKLNNLTEYISNEEMNIDCVKDSI